MTRIHLLLAVAAVIAPAAPAQAQEGERCLPARDESGGIVLRGGLALDENGDFCGSFSDARMQSGLLRGADGKWAAPTPESALRALRLPSELEGFSVRAPARAVLTQRFDAYSRAELDAFADELVEIVLSEGIPRASGHRSDVAKAAMLALSGSRASRHGVPYEGAFGAMFRLWEASAGDAPPGERWDPLGTLVSLYGIEPEGRGRDILHAEIAASGPPGRGEGPRTTTWCKLVQIVYGHFTAFGTPPEVLRRGEDAVVARALRQLDEEMRDLPGDARLYATKCGAGEIRVP